MPIKIWSGNLDETKMTLAKKFQYGFRGLLCFKYITTIARTLKFKKRKWKDPWYTFSNLYVRWPGGKNRLPIYSLYIDKTPMYFKNHVKSHI